MDFPKKNYSDNLILVILFFVKKENNLWNLKQYPKVNGGIVVNRSIYWRR